MNDDDRMTPDHDSAVSRSNDPSRSSEASHSSHDLVEVAALAAGDLEGTERTAIEAIVASCSSCRLLFDDLRSIAQATAALPAVPRSRDFRLSVEDAARLRPAGWRRVLAALSGARLAIPRSVAIGLTTIGVAGLVFSAIPTGGLAGFGTSAAAPRAVGQDSTAAGGESTAGPNASGTFSAPGFVAQGPGAASAAPSAAASAAAPPPSLLPTPIPAGPTAGPAGGGTTGGGTPAPTNATTKNDVSPGPSQPVTAVTGAGPGASDRSAPAPGIGAGVPGVPATGGTGGTWGSGGGPSPLAIGSAICLLVGLGLLLARRAARGSSGI
jgi:hypothetical protein